MRDTLLVVGNGLAIDLRMAQPELLLEWDTRAPIGWAVPTPGGSGEAFLVALPSLQAALAGLPCTFTSDFERLSTVARSAKEAGDTRLIVELRHFLALSFARYQLEADRALAAGWPLGNWLAAHAHRLLGAFSFNYEVTLEKVLVSAGCPLGYLGVTNQVGGLPIAKPHGSIDYALHDMVIGGQAPEYPIQIFMEQINAPIKKLPWCDLFVPRYSVEIVVPNEQSLYTDYQWVTPARRWLKAVAAHVRTVLIVGLSYWDVDRPEIDMILNSLDPAAKAIVLDPVPSRDLVDHLHSRGLTVATWTKGPELLP